MVRWEVEAGLFRSGAISCSFEHIVARLSAQLHYLRVNCVVLCCAGEDGVTENGWGQTANELLFGDGGYCVADDVAKFQ